MVSPAPADNNLTAINLALTISAPISSVPGSASFFMLQPILTGKIIGAAGVLIGAQLFLVLAKYIFGLKNIPLADPANPAHKISIPIDELQALLGSIAANTVEAESFPRSTAGGGEFLVQQTAEIPVVVSIALYAHYSPKDFYPTTYLIVPVFTLPGLRGALPILILEILSTILVRAVVPPQTTGAKPLAGSEQTPSPRLYLTTDELLKMLEKFSRYFK
ncbi:hypothetical protein JCM15765_42200 [Paradesulfitobacterium aromaticivorans]